jgi:uncharacterized protein with HEPN domain
MQKDDTVSLGHMPDMARKIPVREPGISKADYDANEDLRFVIAHLIQTVGEAAARVSTQTRQAYPEIPWKNITSIRHCVVHDYLGVDYDILWEVAVRHIPSLIANLEAIIPPQEQ